jgi:hypothetical protein
LDLYGFSTILWERRSNGWFSMERKQLPRAVALAGLVLATAAVTLPTFDEASAAPRIRGSGPGFHSVSRGDSFRRWHGPRRHHGFVGGHHRFFRGWGGVYLDRGWDNGGVNVSIQQNIAPGSGGSAPFYVPSVSELPAVAGIREVRPTQPAIYVVNDGRGGGAPATSGLRRPSVTSQASGPRILEVTPDGDWVTTTGSIGQAEQGSGPRIIHLTVPVGSDR